MKIYSKFRVVSILSLSLIAISCGEDDNPINDVQIDDAPTAVSTATISIDDAIFYGSPETVPFNISLASSTSNDVQVLLNATDAFEDNETIVYIDSGSTSANSSITIPSTLVEIPFEETSMYDFEVQGARIGEIENDEDGNFVSFTPSGEDSSITTSNVASIPVFDQVPTANNGGLNFLMDWNSPTTNDLDLEVIDRAFTAIFESSASGSRYESDVFNNTNPDGDYDFYYTIFDAVELTTLEDINARLFVIDSDGIKTLLEFTIPAGTLTNERISFATFNQTTVDTVIGYSNISLL